MTDTDVVTGKVRLSYTHLFKPYAREAGQDEKYSTTVLLPKSDTDTLDRINAAIEAAKEKGRDGKWNGAVPPVVNTPVHDGDGVRPTDGMPYGDECKGHWVFTASSRAENPPEIVDRNGSPIINQSEMYSGVYARVCINVYPYNSNGRKGIGFGLGPVQKLEDGEALGGQPVSAADAFGAAPAPAAASAVDPLTGLPV